MHHSLSTLRRPAPKSICERQSQHQPPLERATTSSLLRRTCDLPTRPPERFQVRRSTQVAATSAGAGERPLPAAVHPHWTCHPIHCGPPKSPHIGWVAQISTHRMGRPNLHTRVRPPWPAIPTANSLGGFKWNDTDIPSLPWVTNEGESILNVPQRECKQCVKAQQHRLPMCQYMNILDYVIPNVSFHCRLAGPIFGTSTMYEHVADTIQL